MAPEVARAQTPMGDWLVADGSARIRIVDCGDALWGVVAWTKSPRGYDVHNPNATQRTRPILGLPVLLHMRPAEDTGTWEGEVYNAKNGKTYDATMTLRNEDILHIEGCTYAVLCGGEDWQRVTPADSATTGNAAVSDSTEAVCSRIPTVSRRPHQDRLEQDRSGERAHQR